MFVDRSKKKKSTKYKIKYITKNRVVYTVYMNDSKHTRTSQIIHHY